MENVVINGVRYEVVEAHTPESHEAAGRDMVASFMRSQGRTRDLIVKRPKGRVHFLVAEFGEKLELRTKVS